MPSVLPWENKKLPRYLRRALKRAAVKAAKASPKRFPDRGLPKAKRLSPKRQDKDLRVERVALAKWKKARAAKRRNRANRRARSLSTEA